MKYGTALVCLGLFGEPALGVKCSHAAITGGRHSLSIDVVGDIASGEDSGYARGGGARLLNEVAVAIHVEHPLEESSCRVVPNRDEEPGAR
jgi:hypothetical protein